METFFLCTELELWASQTYCKDDFFEGSPDREKNFIYVGTTYSFGIVRSPIDRYRMPLGFVFLGGKRK